MKAASLGLLLALISPAVHAAVDVESVRLCVQENSPRVSSVQVLTLTVRELGQPTSESRMKLYWRRLPTGERRLLLRFETPRDLAGAAVLVQMSPNERPVVHLQLPDIGKPVRITSRSQFESFLGEADLGMEELRQLVDPLSGEDLRLVEVAGRVSGRSAWVMEERDGGKDARYPRVVSFIDQEYCLPLRAEFYDAEGAVRKLLRVDPAQVSREAQSWMPRELVFTDLESGRDSVLRVEEIEVDVTLAPALLTVRALSRPGARPSTKSHEGHGAPVAH